MAFKPPEHCSFHPKCVALRVLNGFIDVDGGPFNPSEVLEHGLVHKEIWFFCRESRTYHVGIQERGPIDVEVRVMPEEESRVKELDTHPVKGQWGVSQLEKLSLKGSLTFDIFEDSFVYY